MAGRGTIHVVFSNSEAIRLHGKQSTLWKVGKRLTGVLLGVLPGRTSPSGNIYRDRPVTSKMIALEQALAVRRHLTRRILIRKPRACRPFVDHMLRYCL